MSLMPANIGATVFLAMILAYWLTVLLGALDLDFLDFDLDADVDADLGSDLDVSVGVFDGMLAFFYLGKIPLMILLSIFALCLWVISIIANGYLNPSGSLALGLPLAVGNLIVSPFICKVICAPLARFFMALKRSMLGGRYGPHLQSNHLPSVRNGASGGLHTGPDTAECCCRRRSCLQKGDEAVVIGKR